MDTASQPLATTVTAAPAKSATALAWEQWGYERIIGCLALLITLGLLVGWFGAVLFADHNFIYRDAGHFYYPYWELITRECLAGRLPLWNPYENGGEPLAAQPTACVFYPGKLLFFLFAYPWAYKLYTLLHLLLAGSAMFTLTRHWGRSVAASSLAAFAYAGSGIVLFQIYNIIFLVGAAWLPLGILAIGNLLEAPRLKWILVLSVVITLQVLGGDPQIAYLTGVVSVVWLTFVKLGIWRGSIALSGLLASGWVWVQFKAAVELPTLLLVSALGLGLVVAFWRFAAGPWRAWRQGVLGLALAGLLAGGCSAIQVLPTQELVNVSDRVAPAAPRNPMAFSGFPARVLEFWSPAVFGRMLPIDSRWAPFTRLETGIWVPSWYLGLPALLLALSALPRWRYEPKVRFAFWLTVFFLWLAIGKYGGLNYWQDASQWLPVDMVRTAQPRPEHGNSDGLYALAEITLPGFRSFRYPAKMLVFVAFGIALLAAYGCDYQFQTTRSNPMLFWCQRLFYGLCLFSCLLAWCLRLNLWLFADTFISWIKTFDLPPSSFGEPQLDLACVHTAAALMHTASVTGMLVVWCHWRGFALNEATTNRPARRQVMTWLAGALLLLTGADLFWAQRWLILTDAQDQIERPSEIAGIIARAEQAEQQELSGQTGTPSPLKPFRIHRTKIYAPVWWHQTSSLDRVKEMTAWERDTLQPKYGLHYDLSYCSTIGTMSIYDVEFFFSPFVISDPPAPIFERLQKDKIVYYPRIGFNLWNTKYFVLPKLPVWDNENRGTFNFLENAVEIAASDPRAKDYVVLKNQECFPRAWIVHQVEWLPPIQNLDRAARAAPIEKLLIRKLDFGFPLWPHREYGEYPLRNRAMLEAEDAAKLLPYLSDQFATEAEQVRFLRYEPNRIVCDVTLEQPGFLILADTYFRGWTATVDGQPQPIYRANLAMRAVPVPTGTHLVEFRFFSHSLALGAVISSISVAISFALAWVAWRRSSDPA